MQFECTCEADYKVDFCEIAVLFSCIKNMRRYLA